MGSKTLHGEVHGVELVSEEGKGGYRWTGVPYRKDWRLAGGCRIMVEMKTGVEILDFVALGKLYVPRVILQANISRFFKPMTPVPELFSYQSPLQVIDFVLALPKSCQRGKDLYDVSYWHIF